MTLKRRRTVFTGNTAATVGLGAAYGRVVGYNTLSSADTSVSIACVDANGKTILTVASADFTTAVEKTLTAENAVTEDGTAATGNAGFGGVVAKSPLTITPGGIGSGSVTFDVYVEV